MHNVVVGPGEGGSTTAGWATDPSAHNVGAQHFRTPKQALTDLCLLLPVLLPAGDDDDAPVTASKKKGGAGGKSGASAGAGGAGGAGAKKKVAKSVWSRVQKFLFGWARTTLKVNGKKLLPYTTFLWRYMVRVDGGMGGRGGEGLHPLQ